MTAGLFVENLKLVIQRSSIRADTLADVGHGHMTGIILVTLQVLHGAELRYNTGIIRRPVSWEDAPIFRKCLDTRVSILKMHPGITPQIVRDIMCSPDTRAVIIETYGAGNAPSKEWFLKIVQEAAGMGKIILNVTQCIAGSVNMDIYATGKCLKDAGVVSGYDSTTESALAKLFYLLGTFQDNEQVKKLLEEDLRGEISK